MQEIGGENGNLLLKRAISRVVQLSRLPAYLRSGFVAGEATTSFDATPLDFPSTSLAGKDASSHALRGNFDLRDRNGDARPWKLMMPGSA